MRWAAFVVLDWGLLLGSTFGDARTTTVDGLEASSATGTELFAAVARYLPGAAAAGRAKVKQDLAATASHLGATSSTKGIGQAGALEEFGEDLAISDDELAVMAAGLGRSTNYFEHTGIQAVARRVISGAYAEI